jgi:monofunctional biosynthetic peptidoglycan transglycosylase
MIGLLGFLPYANHGSSGDTQLPAKENTTRVLFEFVDASEAERWIVVNDGVMRGVSRGGALPPEDGCLLFSGSISVENDGGFASIRSQPKDFGLSGFQGLRIRVTGDGRVYQFRMRTDRHMDGIAFKHEFETIDDTWTELDFPFASFIATYRGWTLTDVKPLDAAGIRPLGFLLADKTAGPLKLTVDNSVAGK